MYEKVNPSHPDKLADRIAGAIVDLVYKKIEKPRIAVEVLLGHGTCNIICESSVSIKRDDILEIVDRIAPGLHLEFELYHQDQHLENNQLFGYKCGDNGIFKGVPITDEQKKLTEIAKTIYDRYPTDGKYILAGNDLIICQSNAEYKELYKIYPNARINPLGSWTGGPDVDCGATNRKLGSDMGDSITGGGLHGKDLSKADVSVNIYAFLKAQETGKPVELYCAIGDKIVDGKPYSEIVNIAKEYIDSIGGFEKFAEWGLIR